MTAFANHHPSWDAPAANDAWPFTVADAGNLIISLSNGRLLDPRPAA